VNYRLAIRSDAVDEIANASAWYDEHGPGLGAEFLRAVDVAIEAVRRKPFQHPVVVRDLRRALLRRFPYSIIFAVSDDEVAVVALAHWRQNPRRWRTRR
jgi:hypothetical protein